MAGGQPDQYFTRPALLLIDRGSPLIKRVVTASHTPLMHRRHQPMHFLNANPRIIAQRERYRQPVRQHALPF